MDLWRAYGPWALERFPLRLDGGGGGWREAVGRLTLSADYVVPPVMAEHRMYSEWLREFEQANAALGTSSAPEVRAFCAPIEHPPAPRFRSQQWPYAVYAPAHAAAASTWGPFFFWWNRAAPQPRHNGRLSVPWQDWVAAVRPSIAPGSVWPPTHLFATFGGWEATFRESNSGNQDGSRQWVPLAPPDDETRLHISAAAGNSLFDDVVDGQSLGPDWRGHVNAVLLAVEEFTGRALDDARLDQMEVDRFEDWRAEFRRANWGRKTDG